MTIPQYIENINKRYKLGNATEHTFRGDLQQLIESVVPGVAATNEPKRQSCGAPDYILTKKDIPVGFIEAKDVGDKDLEGNKKTGNKEQFDRYKASLNNLIFTDYLDFHLYRDGIFVTKIAIARIEFPSSGGVSANGGRGGQFPSTGGAGVVVPIPENFSSFENLLKDFCTHISQSIKSSKKLAEMMAGKARLLSEVIEKALTSDETNQQDSTLKDQMNAFKEILIHDITPKGFADVYAQTIAYGMFAARLHDPTLPTFSRQEAAELIPKSNPFLRKLFGYIAGPDIDDRIKWIVDSLVDIFLACNVEEILKNYGKTTKMENPIIHFYETFLSEYDSKLRKARGVYYTSTPVVNFQVRAIDEILKTEFNLPQGIADSSKIKIKVNVQGNQVEQEVHKVQMLDPATGTGTYLAEVIKQIHKKFEGQQGIWSNYVETHLLPRLIGFELLMASYAMAHLQIDLLLTETGYTPSVSSSGVEKNQRLKIFLTNSLEESHPDTGTLFASWLSSEANEANRIKRDCPVMVVMGNPPYSGESANKGEWIMNLMEDYKKEPGGKEKLKERNPKWINDDYVKFLRYGQHFIEKNGSGVLSFINPHGFLDNPTFRGMRWNLLKTYDKIYTIDLHGNSKKKEKHPDGSIDTNVFDIMQGVSINIFVKTGKKKANELGKVFHFDLYGKREFKYDFLTENGVSSIDYKELPNVAPNYFFVNKDFDSQKGYDKGFKVNDIFTLNNVGIVTSRDGFVTSDSKADLVNRIKNFFNFGKEEILSKYDVKENNVWKIDDVKQKAKAFDENNITFISYRPFDVKYIYYNNNFIERSRNETMQHFIKGRNIGIVFKLGNAEENSVSAMVSKTIIDFRSWSRPGMQGGDYLAPLYILPETIGQQTIGQTAERTPNLNLEIVKQIAEKLGLTFTNEKLAALHSAPVEGCLQGGVVNNGIVNKTPRPTDTPLKEGNDTQDVVKEGNYTQDLIKEENDTQDLVKEGNDTQDLIKEGNSSQAEINENTFAPIDILDYIYAVLHSPTYREKYKEFLKIDFPRVPYPKDVNTFWQLVKLGGEIRQIHLLESSTVENYITQYPINGNNVVGKIKFVLSAPQHSPPSILNAPQPSPPLEGCLEDGVVNTEPTNVVNKQTTQEVNKQTTQEANKTVVIATINNQIIFRNFVDNLPYNPKLKPLLKEKRKAGILSEVLFWQQVHKNKFHKIDFDRQRIIGNYIVDFYVKTLGLVIEIDGSSHDDKQDYDRERQHYLESLGLKVFRITDADVKKNIERAMKDLEVYIIEQYGVGSVYEPPRPAGTPPTEGNFSQDVTNNNDYLQDVTSNTDYLQDKTKKQVGKVYINDTQYFDNVPQIAWEFYIGGYQPAQKWLKDRKERELSFDDILHYQKIIVALSETDRLMKEIDNIVIE